MGGQGRLRVDALAVRGGGRDDRRGGAPRRRAGVPRAPAVGAPQVRVGAPRPAGGAGDDRGQGRTPATMLAPAAVLLGAALALGVLPGLTRQAERGAARFEDRRAYA